MKMNAKGYDTQDQKFEEMKKKESKGSDKGWDKWRLFPFGS